MSLDRARFWLILSISCLAILIRNHHAAEASDPTCSIISNSELINELEGDHTNDAPTHHP